MNIQAAAQAFVPGPESFRCSHYGRQQTADEVRQQAGASRSDTIDVQHYKIELDLSNLAVHSLKGSCELIIRSKINGLQEVLLDLKALSVDSVKVGGNSTSFTKVGELLTVQLPSSINSGDVVMIKVFYGGTPATDGSGFGGFYFSGSTMAYNIGVAFSDDPHNYGRVWFPCVDNFIDRATYEFFIRTASSNKAFCSGLLSQMIDNMDGTVTWHWELSQTIPTYLASVAVSNYTSIEYMHNAENGPVPVILGARAIDTTDMKASFTNLPAAIDAFEEDFGPYRFDRVGFVLVPFNGGAMEHATNIAYPLFAVDGTLNYEDLMAHEFSHHWWGDLVTCATPEDMWLNEGWASYSENTFYEHVYGKERYKKEVRANHKDVLQFTHIYDDGYRAVSGVSHDYTYSSTVYDKGADVAHTLRGYMGDTKFFSCLQDYLDTYKFNHASSDDFRDALSSCSGIDLSSFFEDWVKNPGFPHFSIDSFTSLASGGEYEVTVHVRQRLKGASDLYNNVPLEITYYDANWNKTSMTAMVSGGCVQYTSSLNFQPVFVALDMDEKISDAITDKYLTITSTGNVDFEEAMWSMNVTQLSDSALVRVEHNWVAPDAMNPRIPKLHLSDERYWKIDGIWPGDFKANATIDFNGTTSTSTGYLDNDLITNAEDSLVVVYRKGAGYNWALADSFSINTQSNSFNKRGQATIYNVKKGEYALAIYDSDRTYQPTPFDSYTCIEVGVKETEKKTGFRLYPNPADNYFTIEPDLVLVEDSHIRVFSTDGRIVWDDSIKAPASKLRVSTGGWAKGTYLVQLSQADAATVEKVIVIK